MHTDEGSIRGVYFLAGSAVIGTICTASVALAGIVSGSVATAQSGSAKITQLSISEPAHVMPGDLLLANIAVDGGSEADITPPTGWTQILRTDNDSDLSVISYWKIASAAEPASYAWSIDNQTHAEGGITAYSGINQANPIDAANGDTGYGVVATTSPLTTASANEEVVALYAARAGKKANAGDYFSTPSSMTEKYDVSNTPFGPSIASDDTLQTSVGTTAVRTAAITGKKPRSWASQMIALRMASPKQIAFDSSSIGDYQEGGTSRTWPHTVSGTSTALVVCGATYDTDFTGATYDGVAMTLLADAHASAVYPNLQNLFIACYGLLSPHAGTHDIVLSRSGTFLWIEGEAESFSGVSQVHLPDAVIVDHQTAQNPYVGTIRTTVNNAWGLIFAMQPAGTVSGTADTVIRQTSLNSGTMIADSNGPWPVAGSHSLSLLASEPTTWDAILISLAPAE